MSMTGGYKIIDFKGINLESGTAVNIPGIWDAIESNYHKPTMISGLVIGGTERNNVFAEFTISSSEYVATIVGGSIAVTDGDNVTYTAS